MFGPSSCNKQTKASQASHKGIRCATNKSITSKSQGACTMNSPVTILSPSPSLSCCCLRWNRRCLCSHADQSAVSHHRRVAPHHHPFFGQGVASPPPPHPPPQRYRCRWQSCASLRELWLSNPGIRTVSGSAAAETSGKKRSEDQGNTRRQSQHRHTRSSFMAGPSSPI